MDEKVKKALEKLAASVKSNFEVLPITEIINRIHYFTGRSPIISVKGYRLLRAEGLIEDAFVKDIGIESDVLRMLDDPNIQALAENLDCVFAGASEIPVERVSIPEASNLRAIISNLELTVNF